MELIFFGDGVMSQGTKQVRNIKINLFINNVKKLNPVLSCKGSGERSPTLDRVIKHGLFKEAVSELMPE